MKVSCNCCNTSIKFLKVFGRYDGFIPESFEIEETTRISSLNGFKAVISSMLEKKRLYVGQDFMDCYTCLLCNMKCGFYFSRENVFVYSGEMLSEEESDRKKKSPVFNVVIPKVPKEEIQKFDYGDYAELRNLEERMNSELFLEKRKMEERIQKLAEKERKKFHKLERKTKKIERRALFQYIRNTVDERRKNTNDIVEFSLGVENIGNVQSKPLRVDTPRSAIGRVLSGQYLVNSPTSPGIRFLPDDGTLFAMDDLDGGRDEKNEDPKNLFVKVPSTRSPSFPGLPRPEMDGKKRVGEPNLSPFEKNPLNDSEDFEYSDESSENDISDCSGTQEVAVEEAMMSPASPLSGIREIKSENSVSGVTRKKHEEKEKIEGKMIPVSKNEEMMEKSGRKKKRNRVNFGISLPIMINRREGAQFDDRYIFEEKRGYYDSYLDFKRNYFDEVKLKSQYDSKN